MFQVRFLSITVLYLADRSKRIKGAIDSRIAEEQARAKATGQPIASPASGVRRSTSTRTESPARRPARPKPREIDDGTRGPDPSEFETAFVIEDESEPPSRVGTPASSTSKPDTMGENGTVDTASDGTDNPSEKGSEKATQSPITSELPPDVKAKLRKLEKLESRYQGMNVILLECFARF